MSGENKMVAKKKVTGTKKSFTICVECPHRERIESNPEGKRDWCKKYNVPTRFVPKSNGNKKLTSWKQC